MQHLLGVLGATLVSGLAGSQAAKSPTLRWNATANDSMYTDYRFLMTVGGVGLSFLAGDKGPMADFGTVVAAGAGSSLATSEMFRREAIAQAEKSAAEKAANAPAGTLQLPPVGVPPRGQQFAPQFQSPFYDYAV
jgi:2-keto-3-deoxy-6-phosphogluconate aldolase